jgi:quercetin dioxygenase-like cupin family protein
MPLHVPSENVRVRNVVRAKGTGTGSMEVRQAYGTESSFMHAIRAPGYHTTPHQHLAEQINYVLDGEIWFFVEDQAFHCKTGDFQRIPSNKVHWAWNRSDAPATVMEVHSPALIEGYDPEELTPLFAAGEERAVRTPCKNEWVDFDQAAVERIHFGAEVPAGAR